MTHSQLKLFVKIVDTGSFTRAGQELNMTQPAVSRAISTLESELGVTLLIRDRRKGIVLTEVGKRILVLFRDILKGFDKVDQEVAAEKGFDVGWIIPPNEEFEAVTLLKEQMFLFMREDHPLHQHDRIHVKHLDQEPMIICKGGYEAPLYELFEQGGSRLQAQFIVHNANTALNMIEEGLGMAIMSNVSLSLSTLPPHVVIRLLEPQPYREILLAVPSLEESSLAVKLFIQTARELFSI
ncbi:LysR family transcriptional regulator [Paenibacillus sp. 32352]|uniref:LysR family transcriptional regulator n=1 Tax=Paenibacillus sp. 32352 TaxID=1969111 RepID=UPI0009ADF92C|nr:LysR family transcriptional regulator [Paenibacillus sp. 32352]